MSGVWSPLTTNWAVTSECRPRPGGVDSIGHHHAAGTNLQNVLDAAQPGGRDLSMNYVIYRDQIWGVVPENMRAYTSADASADGRSITYEIINSSGGPDWSFDPVTLDTVKRLDADIMRRYGVKPVHALPGFWEHRNLWEWFGRSYPTACAGPSFRIYDIITGAVAYSISPNPTPPQEEEDDDMAKNSGVFWTRPDGITEYMVFNPDSGFEVHHTGAYGDYNNGIAATMETGNWALISYSHAANFMAALKAVRDSKASGTVKIEIPDAVEVNVNEGVPV